MAKNTHRIFTGFGYVFNGIWTPFRDERHMQFPFFVAIADIAVGFFFNISALDWCAVCFCIALVFTTEVINTAFENLCDLVIQEKHPIVKKIKDMAAGDVLICAIVSVVVECIIFIPKIATLFIT